MPDGTRLLFQSMRTGHTELYSMRTDGSNLTQITSNTYSSTVPEPAPDGATIVFQDGRISGNTELYKMNMDGTSLVRLTNNPNNDVSASYAPSGNRIAFNRFSGGVNYIYTMNPDGTEEMPSTTAGADGRAPDWQPIPNTAPVTVKDSLSTPINAAASIDVLANDTDEEALNPANLSITSAPTHGTATITDGKVTYTPANGYIGADQVTYTICDSFLLDQKCATGVLGITVSAGPAPAMPTITSVGTVQVNGQTKIYYTGHRPTFAGTAAPGSTITVDIHSDSITLTTTADNQGHWSVTPDRDLPNGDHTVTITATKDGATSTSLASCWGLMWD
ncbi:MAG: Ig-like domain-containing protein [Thermomicrobiales bacterium]